MATITAISTMAKDATTISVSKKTRDRLAEFGSKKETFDDVINRLIEEAGWRRQLARWQRIFEEDEFIPLEKL